MTVGPWRFFGALLAVAVLCRPATAQESDFPPLPPLNEPATALALHGKFVWADLFSSDIDKVRGFYSDLFDWEWRYVSSPPKAYGMFYKDGIAVAGLAKRDPPEGAQAYGTWVYYVSVADVAATEAAFAERGGEALLPRRSMPQRGDFSILADPDGAILGIMRSSSGDPEDFQAAVGEFIWYQLFTRELDPAAEFYETLFGYDIYEKEETPEIVDYILSADGYSRAGIGALPENSETVPTWLGYVRVADVGAAITKAEELGGSVLLPPTEERLGGDMAIIADPEGTPIGLLRWTYPEPGETQQ